MPIFKEKPVEEGAAEEVVSVRNYGTKPIEWRWDHSKVQNKTDWVRYVINPDEVMDIPRWMFEFIAGNFTGDAQHDEEEKLRLRRKHGGNQGTGRDMDWEEFYKNYIHLEAIDKKKVPKKKAPVREGDKVKVE